MLIKVRAGLTIPIITTTLIDTVFSVTSPQPRLLMHFALIVFGATIIQALASYFTTRMLSLEGQRLMTDLRTRVQRHVGQLPISFFDGTSTGTTVSRIMNDVEGVRNLIGSGLMDFAGSLLTAVWVLSYMFHRSVPLTLDVLGLIITFGVAIKVLYGVLRPLLAEGGRQYAQLTGRLTEAISGIRVVKTYNAEAREADNFAAGARQLLETNIQATNVISLLGLASASVTGIITMCVMLLGGRLVLEKHWTLGDYVQYTLFLGFLIAPVYQLISLGTHLTTAIVGLERTLELLSLVDEERSTDAGKTFEWIEGTVRFEGVSFSYQPDKQVLTDISFEAPPNTVTALVGASGAGKSTIINLLCAFYSPLSGRILVDELDICSVSLRSFRSHLSIVLQDTFLFDGSIRDNVMLSRPSSTEEEFIVACRTARVSEFAERFSEGYETVVGERGVKLSGGQRQRLSIARALLAQPRILILDEATSSLDSHSEEMIQAGLSTLMRGRTTFVIAHRLSTIRRADQILVIDDGRIVERGNHDELLAARGLYYDYYSRQYEVV